MKNRMTFKSEWIYVILMTVVGVVFFFFLGDSSYAMYKDSTTFIEWSYDTYIRQYMLYPFFLRFCRMIFGEEIYLQVVNWIQCLLALSTTIVLEEYVRRTYKLGYIESFVSFLAICGVYGYSLPEVVASHYIVTEGLTFPIFSIMLLFLLRYVNDHSYFMLAVSLILSVIMTLIRPQMAFFVIMVIMIAALDSIMILTKRRGSKGRQRVLVYLIPVFVTMLTVIGLYSITMMTGYLLDNTANSQYHEAVTGKVMCVMDESDSHLYDGDIRDGFIALYNDTYNRKGLSEFFPDSILEYEKMQRIIDDNMQCGINIIWRWHDDLYGPSDRTAVTPFRNRIISTELKKHRIEYIGVILRLLPSSLVSSIFIQPPSHRLLCNIIAFALYIMAIVLLYVAYYRKTDRIYNMPMIISLVLIFGNSLLSNIVLYGQQRYVVYCFGLFYISMMILIKGIMDTYQKEKRIEDELV